MISANGAEKIITSIDLYLSNMTKSELNQIDGICAVFDADQKLAKDKYKKKFRNNKKI